MYPKNIIFGTLGVILDDINFKKHISDHRSARFSAAMGDRGKRREGESDN